MHFCAEVSSQARSMLRFFAVKGSQIPLHDVNGRAAKNALKPNRCSDKTRCATRGNNNGVTREQETVSSPKEDEKQWFLRKEGTRGYAMENLPIGYRPGGESLARSSPQNSCT
jgi:hypothetical protein